MPSTLNYGWNTPTVGGDEDTWGDELNTTIQAIDAQVGRVGRQLLSSGTVSSAMPTLDIEIPSSTMPGTAVQWREFELFVAEFEPVNDGVTLQALLAFDSGPNYQSSDYRYTGFGTVDTAASQFGSTGASHISLHNGYLNSVGGLNPGLVIRIRTPASPGHNTILTWSLDFIDTTADRDALFTGRGRYAGTGDRATYLRLKFSSGNISAARWVLFGVPGL